MINFITSLSIKTIVFSQELATVRAKVTEEGLTNRIFGLDFQMLADTLIVALAVFILFLALSYLLFNPARELLLKRQEKVQGDLEFSAQEKKEAMTLKSDYEAKLNNASQEVDEILREGRSKALKRENEIVDEAKLEASRILDRATKEIALEKSKVRDEMKQEMISVATAMAEKIITVNIDTLKQAQLVEEALSEMGDDTWKN